MNSERIKIYIISFITGFSFMGYEILGSRMLAPYFGGAVYVWAAMISVFMLGLSVGYALGGKFSSENKKYKYLIYIFIISFFFLFIISFLSGYICIFILQFDIDNRISVLISSLMLFFVPGILWGVLPPFLVTIVSDKEDRIGNCVGKVYSFSTAGSIAGVLFTAFVLTGCLGTASNIRLLSLPLIFCSLLVYLIKKPE